MDTALLLTDVALVVAHLAVAAWLVAFERRKPTVTLSWVLAILFLPVLGVVAYALVGRPRVRWRRRKAEGIDAKVAAMIEERGLGAGTGRSAEDAGPRSAPMWRLGERVTGMPVTGGNRCEILEDGERAFGRMLAAIDAAKDHLHVQFYIFRDDVVGQTLRDRLAQKAREGLVVRVLVDAVGSAMLSDHFWLPVREAGGHVAQSGPLWGDLGRIARFVGRASIDLRNHKKLLLVDGRVGFLGGMNVGREYWRGEGPGLMGAWRDMQVRVEGPAVISMQESFIRDWLAETGELCTDERLFPARPPIDEEDPGEDVQIVAGGPNDEFPSLEPLYLQAIASARERVWVTTPYFVPTDAIEQALVRAALRGVDVRVLVPSKADSVVVAWTTRSWFPAIVRAGAQVFVYSPGFIHAKSLLVDSWLAIVGSANLDARSLHLNFELNAFIYGELFVDALAARYLLDSEQSQVVDREAVLRPSLTNRLLLGAARLLSPLL